MIKKDILLSPGPTQVPEEVLLEASRPLIHHRTPEFSNIFMDTIDGLKYVFQTGEDVYLLASSGTGAMEAAVVNLLCPGDRVLTINGGKFGARWAKICRAYGVEAQEIEVPWGDVYPKEELEQELKGNPDLKAVFSTLCETATGAVFDIQGYGEVVCRTGAVLVVDGISGIGATACPMDDWNVDVLISGSQKSFMTPPGLAYIAFSSRAQEWIERSTLPRFYFDVRAARKALDSRTSPWTPAISLIRQQKKALDRIRDFTLGRLIEHHRILGEATRAGIRALGLELLAKHPGNILTAVVFPEGIDGFAFIRAMQDKYRAYIAGSQEPYKGRFFRIAHLGYMSGYDILTALSAVEMALSDFGFENPSGKAVAAAEIILKEHWK
ncbi:MAG: alanine--glyoxylate aminotransferase family protein [Acidobacteria bacterium]|nr:alanine--glyoxylate aminotransferase family protein [Acidobacteriota bacterium]MBU4496216.1 alanine--glyoxylate aminotransferase family protein [Acidobacteriota bacterium]MCG2814367.1 alanine--glyoxylate aminotransferase family protein [Candidatus Aminicenantes bacterium]